MNWNIKNMESNAYVIIIHTVRNSVKELCYIISSIDWNDVIYNHELNRRPGVIFSLSSQFYVYYIYILSATLNI